MGYVGLSNALLLAQNNKVIAIDIDKEKIKLINEQQIYIDDEEAEECLKKVQGNLTAISEAGDSYKSADFVIISTPTDYDETTNYFNTSSVEKIIQLPENKYDNHSVPITITTHKISKNKLNKAISKISNQDFVVGKINIIPIKS